jgi:succinoglycan biosynthesis protein ExoM
MSVNSSASSIDTRFIAGMTPIPQISVCVCTFKRSARLSTLLGHLEAQRTDGLFTYGVVIADNDAARSAEQAVVQYATTSPMRIAYCVEPEQNIALVRNRAVANAEGELLAFIDDDELPVTDWLYELFRTRSRYEVDGVLGPVLARFQGSAPRWLTKGKFFDRPRHPTGDVVDWTEGRTGNVLLSRDVLRQLDPPFRSQFGSGGEDVDFFRRAIESGFKFVWCDEAVVHEFLPAYRCTRKFVIRRALLRGSNFPKQSAPRAKNVFKSIVAIPAYAVALPFLAITGHHLFMAYLAKLFEHASRLLALAGLPLLTERDT